MLEYDFMQNAFAAATIVAIVSGLVGYFLVLRGQAFAGQGFEAEGARFRFGKSQHASDYNCPSLWQVGVRASAP